MGCCSPDNRLTSLGGVFLIFTLILIPEGFNESWFRLERFVGPFSRWVGDPNVTLLSLPIRVMLQNMQPQKIFHSSTRSFRSHGYYPFIQVYRYRRSPDITTEQWLSRNSYELLEIERWASKPAMSSTHREFYVVHHIVLVEHSTSLSSHRFCKVAFRRYRLLSSCSTADVCLLLCAPPFWSEITPLMGTSVSIQTVSWRRPSVYCQASIPWKVSFPYHWFNQQSWHFPLRRCSAYQGWVSSC